MNFNYYNPKNLTDLLEVIGQASDYRLLAGGTDLIVRMKENHVNPENVVDLNAVNELKGIIVTNDYLEIGSLVTHTQLERTCQVKHQAYILAEAASMVGSVQIRNMGTVGGNIANASPAADTVPALMVLNAKVELLSKEGKEEKELHEIFISPGKTSIKNGQIISKISVPIIKESEGAAFIKIGKRKALAISVVNGAVWMKVNDGVISDVRIALGSVAPTTIRLFDIEKWLIGKNAESNVFEEAGRMAYDFVKPIDDIRSTAEYRKSMVKTIVTKALDTAFQRSKGGV